MKYDAVYERTVKHHFLTFFVVLPLKLKQFCGAFKRTVLANKVYNKQNNKQCLFDMKTLSFRSVDYSVKNNSFF